MPATEKAAQVPLITLEPTHGWRAIPWREILEYRDLLVTLAVRDVKLRYRQTAIGAVWVVLQPLIGAGLFTFVFAKVAKITIYDSKVPFFVFSFAGLLCWNIFAQLLQRCSDVMINNAGLVSKIYFPRIVLPLSVVGAVYLDFAVSSVLLIWFVVYYHVWSGLAVLWVPWAILMSTLLGLGLGMFAAALNVRYRDVRYVIPVILQFLTWGCPIAYTIVMVPPRLKMVVNLNPMAWVLEIFRLGAIDQPTAAAGSALIITLVSIAVFYFGATFFHRNQRQFADII